MQLSCNLGHHRGGRELSFLENQEKQVEHTALDTSWGLLIPPWDMRRDETSCCKSLMIVIVTYGYQRSQVMMLLTEKLPNYLSHYAKQCSLYVKQNCRCAATNILLFHSFPSPSS